MKTFIEVRGEDGSLVKIRASEINLIQLPPSHLSLAGSKGAMAANVLVGTFMLTMPVLMAEMISNMLDAPDTQRQDNAINN
jgi:hypothetical protein